MRRTLRMLCILVLLAVMALAIEPMPKKRSRPIEPPPLPPLLTLGAAGSFGGMDFSSMTPQSLGMPRFPGPGPAMRGGIGGTASPVPGNVGYPGNFASLTLRVAPEIGFRNRVFVRAGYGLSLPIGLMLAPPGTHVWNTPPPGTNRPQGTMLLYWLSVPMQQVRGTFAELEVRVKPRLGVFGGVARMQSNGACRTGGMCFAGSLNPAHTLLGGNFREHYGGLTLYAPRAPKERLELGLSVYGGPTVGTAYPSNGGGITATHVRAWSYVAGAGITVRWDPIRVR